MAFITRRITRTSQPQELVGIDPASGWSDALVGGVNVDTGVRVYGADTVTPQGKSNLVTLGSAQTQPLGIPKTASWSILFSGSLVSKISVYPYFLGCAGAANAFALALNHGSFAGRATFYDGVGIADSGISLSLGEYATIGLVFDSVSGILKWYKNGVAFASVSAANVGGTAWKFASATTENNVTSQLLLAFARKALSPGDMLAATSNPWQLFNPITETIWIPDTVSGGGLSITATLGTTEASGYSATVNRQSAITGTLATASASGNTASIGLDSTITASLATATASGQTASVNLSSTITAGQAFASAIGYTAAVNRHLDITASLASATASGYLADMQFGGDLSINAELATATASGLAAVVGYAVGDRVDPFIAVISGNQKRMHARYEEEKRKLDDVFTITEVAPKRRMGTISLAQLVGKEAAAQINQIDMEVAIQRVARAKRRRQDDDIMLMM